MGHARWDGFFHHDTIFPLFLFIAGVSFPFSLAKQRAKGISEGRIRARIIRRGLTLVVLGMVYNGLLQLNLDSIRIPSVLGRIGLAWMFAALIYMHGGVRTRIITAVALLTAYTLVLQFVPAPDAPDAGPLTYAGNIVGYVDRTIMPSHLLHPGKFDPEGLLSTVPAIVTALLGMFTGTFVRNDDPKRSGGRKALDVDICVSFTGDAGPTLEKGNDKVGEAYLCVATARQNIVLHPRFKGERNAIRASAADMASEYLITLLEKGSIA